MRNLKPQQAPQRPEFEDFVKGFVKRMIFNEEQAWHLVNIIRECRKCDTLAGKQAVIAREILEAKDLEELVLRNKQLLYVLKWLDWNKD